MTMVQLPGLNTPQFEHCLARVPNQPQPVPPIYEPEVAACAVHWAAHSKRRGHYVGIPTAYTIWGNKIAPWLAEWYLARTGFDSQQVPGEPLGPDRPANLFQPIPGDSGAHAASTPRRPTGACRPGLPSTAARWERPRSPESAPFSLALSACGASGAPGLGNRLGLRRPAEAARPEAETPKRRDERRDQE
jgi:hypothetical protein